MIGCPSTALGIASKTLQHRCHRCSQIWRVIQRRAVGTPSNPLELPQEVFFRQSPSPTCDGFCFFSSDWADLKLPPRHRFPIDKYQLVREMLQDEKFAVLPGPLATFTEACLAHDVEYVTQIFTGMATDEMRRRVGFKEAPMTAYVLRTLASLGATVAALRHLKQRDLEWSSVWWYTSCIC